MRFELGLEKNNLLGNGIRTPPSWRGHENASKHIIGQHMNKLTAFTSESTQRLFNSTSTFAQSNYKYIIRLADKNCNLCGINHKRRGGENNRVSKSLLLELEL